MSKINSFIYQAKEFTITIKSAETKDAERIMGLMKVIDNETTFLLREPDEFNLTLEQEQSFINSKLNSQKGIFITAEIDGKPIATCGLEGSNRKRLQHVANLAIAVKKEYWGIGIGKKLIEASIAWAKDNGISRITLTVDTVNYRAISLYTKLGFEVEGTFRNDKKLADGSYTNGYAMALLL